MDWLLEAFSVLPSTRVHLVSGYKAGEIRMRYPDIDLIHNTEWETTGPAGSLAIAPLSSRHATWVTYSDVVFRPRTVERLEAQRADVVLAVDCAWRTRYDGRARAELDKAEKVVLRGGRVAAIGKDVSTPEADAEFVGLVRLSSATAALLEEWVRSDACSPLAGLPELIGYLLERGASAEVVDVAGDWAELNLPQDLSRFVLGTKAESLARLAPLVRLGRVDEQVAFTQEEWDAGAASVLERVAATFQGARLIVRSSALSEDQWSRSAAGAYESVLDVDGASAEALRVAIERVLDSYTERNPGDQVLVQRMLTDIRVSGVVMTRTPGLGAPYRVFSFDDSSRRADTVTGGKRGVRTVFQHRGEPLPRSLAPELHRLLQLVEELEELVGYDSLDIEFAFTGDGIAHVLQVRPISLAGVDVIDDRSVARGIAEAKRFFEALQEPPPFVAGSRTQLSVMSDWNPAEIIGIKPKRLAFSLYRYLITDEVWARQRAEYGYRDVRPCNLLVDILGHPYVDVRATFNSFVPASLPEPAAERLVEHCLDFLGAHPDLHDKVEFAVLFTCSTFDFDERARERLEGVLTREELAALRAGLTEITRAGMRRCAFDYEAIEVLRGRFERIIRQRMEPLERAYVLLEELRRVGTPLFSHLARAGFVAASLLRSLPRTGCVGESCEGDFLATLRTVSTTIQEDGRRVSRGEMTWEAFVEQYGHLRPGTYDITSPHYASAPELFLRPMVTSAAEVAPSQAAPDRWDAATRAAISGELAKLGLDPDIGAFERFLKHAIEGRELCKFVFTRHLSAALEAIAEFGRLRGLDREGLAHIRIEDLWKLRSARHLAPAETLRLLARRGEDAFRLTEAACLPGQIFSSDDLGCFEQLEATPNFVTGKTVRAPIVCLRAGSRPDQPVEGRIVVIPNADPGFDWLFSRGIAGLVTMYGGGNSHMAIRSAEFGLPAAIGVGELLFEELSNAEVIELDCASQHIRVVR